MTNLKLVLRTYSALRQMSPDDIALLETLRNFNDSEREAFVEALSDRPAAKKSSKKLSKSKIPLCVACGYAEASIVHKNDSLKDFHAFQSPKSQSSSKSPRASGMAAQLSSRRQRQQKVNDGACAFVLEDGAICNTGDNNPIHDESFGYAHYHPFVPSTTAPPAPAPSSANGGVGSITANSGTEMESAGTVAHGVK